MAYVICIPSYGRANICNNKTLKTLHENQIDSSKIYVYVTEEEYDIYNSTLDKRYNKLIIGEKGLVQQRQFIMNQWDANQQIVFFDDDIEKIDLSLSKSKSLDQFIKYAFNQCENYKSYIWGTYPVYNPFFRQPRKEITTHLNYIVGAFYGIINRPQLESIKLSITTNGQKEDVERTLKYFVQDGIVIRFNKIGFKTKYYGKEGGLGTFEERLEPMKKACENLKQNYEKYGSIKVRKNGMHEFVLKKKH